MSSVVLKANDRVLPGFARDDTNVKCTKPFFFIQAADTQLGMIMNYGDGTISEQYPNVTWEREIELCEKTVEIMNAMEPKPAFFIICGDILDAWPDKLPTFRENQKKDFMEVYKKLDKSIPLVCVCGNHDVGNKPTVDTVEEYKRDFGDDYFSFWNQGCHFIVLNSQFFKDGSLVPNLKQAQENWLENELTESAKVASRKHLVMFQHIPWFTASPDEPEDIYFNIDPEQRNRWMNRFKQAGVSKIFTGHYHRNAGGWFDPTLEVVVTTAVGCQLGKDGHGMRIVKVDKDKITHSFHRIDKEEDQPFPLKVTFEE